MLTSPAPKITCRRRDRATRQAGRSSSLASAKPRPSACSIQEERREEKREAMQAERREDAKAIKRFEDAMAAKWRRERPEGLRGP